MSLKKNIELAETIYELFDNNQLDTLAALCA